MTPSNIASETYTHGRNYPKERADELAKKIIHLPRPKPFNPTLPGDKERYNRESFYYKVQITALITLKTQYDDLSVEVARAQKYQKKFR